MPMKQDLVDQAWNTIESLRASKQQGISIFNKTKELQSLEYDAKVDYQSQILDEVLEQLRSATQIKSKLEEIPALKAKNKALRTELRKKEERDRRITQQFLELTWNQGFAIEEEKEEEDDRQQRLFGFISSLL